MTKKQQLTTDGFDLDNELDFDNFNFDDIDANINPESKSDSRKPVAKAFDGAIEGFKDRLSDTSFMSKMVRDSLPKEYGTVMDRADDVGSNVRTLYNDAVKDVKPGVRNLTKQINKLVPANFEKSKKALTALENKLGSDDKWRPTSKEQQQEQDVQTMLASVFQSQAERDAERDATDDSKDQIQTSIEAKRFKTNFEVSNSIALSVGKLANYNEKINSAFQRKSLELQYRSFSILGQQLNNDKEFYSIFKAQNDAISKNTALPEFQKIRKSESFQEMMRNKLMDSTYGALFGKGSFVGKITDTLKSKAKEHIDKFKQRVGEAANIASEASDMKEQAQAAREAAETMGGSNPMDPANMVGGMAGGELAGWIGSKLGKAARKHLSKEGNAVGKKGFDFLRMVNNPAELLEMLLKSKFLKESSLTYDGGIADTIRGHVNDLKGGARDVLNTSLNGDPSMRLDDKTSSGGDNIHQPAIYNNQTQKSIVTVIPGFLSRIHRELKVLRTGNEKEDLTVFDPGKDSFTDKSKLSAGIKKHLTDKLNQYDYKGKLNTVSKNLTKGSDISTEAEEALKKRIHEMSFKEGGKGIEHIMDPKFLETLDPVVAEELKKAVAANYNPDAEDHSKKNEKLSSEMMNLKGAIGDIRGELQKQYNAGNADILKQHGFIKTTNGATSVDYANYKKLAIGENVDETAIEADKLTPKEQNIQKREEVRTTDTFDRMDKMIGLLEKISTNTEGTTSDYNAKTGINRFSPKKALAGIKKVGVSKWKYRKGLGDGGEHIGPMAQDVNAEFGEQAAPDGKKIDLISLNGINMAAIEALRKEVETLREQTKSGNAGTIDPTVLNILQGIKSDTEKMVSSLEKQAASGGFAMPGFDSTSFKDEFGKAKGWTKKQYEAFMKSRKKTSEDSDEDTHDYSGDDKLDKAYHWTKHKLKTGFRRGSKAFGDTAARAKDFAKGLNGGGLKGVREQISKFFDKAPDMAKDALLQSTNTITDIFGSIKKSAQSGLSMLPTGLKGITGAIGKGLKFLDDQLLNVDVYVPGKVDPVLRANLFKAGQYFDQKTGEVLKSIKDIKGTVVDSAGNVVLSTEDFGKGLVDKYGKPISGLGKKLLGGAVGLGVSAFKTAKDGLANLFGLGGKLGERAKDFVNKLGSGFSIGAGSAKTEHLLTQIRDMLNSRLPGEPTKFTEFVPSKPGDAAAKVISESYDKLKDKFKKATETAEEKLKGTPLEGAVGKAKSFYTDAKEKISKITPEDITDKLGSSYDKTKEKLSKITKDDVKSGYATAKESLKDKLTSASKTVTDKLKARAEEAKKRQDDLSNTEKASTDPQYKGPNAVDSLFNVGGSVLGKARGYLEKRKLKKAAEVQEPKVAENTETPEVPEEKKSLSKRARDRFDKAVAAGKKKVEELKEAATKKADEAKKADSDKKPAFNDKDGDGKREGNWEDELKKKQEAAEKRKEAQANTEKASTDPQYKGKNVIDTMIDKAKAAAGGIGAGVGDAVDAASDAKDALDAGKKAGKGAGKAAGKGGLIRRGLGGLWRGAKGAVGLGGRALGGTVGALRTVGTPLASGVSAVANTAQAASVVSKLGMARNALAVGSLATGGLGSALMGGGSMLLTGAGAILSSPVLLGALATAAVGYAGYKTYKYFTRNNVEDIDKFRMLQYGLTEADKSYYHYILETEAYLEAEATGWSDRGATILEGKADIKKLIDIFGISEKDSRAIADFTTWFQNRFKPVYLTHQTAVFSQDRKKKLSEVNDLKPEQKLKYVEAAAFPEGPYSEITSPFADLERLSATGSDVEKAVTKFKETLPKPKKPKVDGEKKEDSQDPKSKAEDTKVDNEVEDSKARERIKALEARTLSNKPELFQKQGMTVSASMDLSPYHGNSVSALQAVRFKAYGLKELSTSVVSALRNLEEYVDKDVVVGSGKNISYRGDVEYVFDQLSSDFGVSSLASDEGIEWLSWFKKRFLPVYLSYVGFGNGLTNKTDTLQIEISLNSTQKLDAANRIVGTSGIWSLTDSPFPNLVMGVDSDITKENIEYLKDSAKKDELAQEKMPVKDTTKPDIPKPPTNPASVESNTKPAGMMSTSYKTNDVTPSSSQPMEPQAPKKSYSTRVFDTGGGYAGSTENLGKSVGGVGAAGVMSDADPMKANPNIKLAPGVDMNGINPSFMSNISGMADEFKQATNSPLQINSGKRSTEKQRALYQANPALAAKPGSSLHEFGLAVDIPSQQTGKLEGLGLLGKYGMARPLGHEPWHVEPAGIQRDRNKAKQDPNFASQAIAQVGGNPMKRDGGIGGQTSANEGMSTASAFTPTVVGGAAQAAKLNISNQPNGREEVKKSIAEVAKTIGVDPAILQTFAAKESSLNPNARPQSGTASGLFQFINSTWAEKVSKYGGKYNIPPGTPQTDIRASTILAGEYIKENLKILSKVKSNPGVTDAYLAHFLGPGGATKFLKADPNRIGAEVLPDAAQANKAVFFSGGRPLTIAEIYQNLNNKLSSVGKSFGIDVKPSDPMVGGKESGQPTGGIGAGSGSSPGPYDDSPSGVPNSFPDQTSSQPSPMTGYGRPSARPGYGSSPQTNYPGGGFNPGSQQPSGYPQPPQTGIAERAADLFGIPSKPMRPSPDQGVTSVFGQSDKIFSSMNDTLTQSLGVQQQMLNALKEIPTMLSKVVAGQTTPAGQPSSGQPTEQASPASAVERPREAPKSAVNLRRVLA